MRITRVIVLLLIVLLISTEVETMAKPTIKSDTPAWLRGAGGGNKGNDQLAQRPDNYKANRPLAGRPNTPAPKNNDTLMDAPDQVPAWMNEMIAAQQALTTGGNLVAGPAGIPAATAAAANYILNGMQGDPKGNDMLQDKAYKTNDTLVNKRLAARSDILRGFQGKGMFDQLQQRGGVGGDGGGYGGYGSYGFGSRYGGNWGGGGGSYGGGGYGDMPAWLANLYLNTWNIR